MKAILIKKRISRKTIDAMDDEEFERFARSLMKINITYALGVLKKRWE